MDGKLTVGTTGETDLLNPVQSFDGQIVAIDKPRGPSSFNIVYQIRRTTGIKRVGHGGTLDPFAEGVLVIGIGRSATRQLGGLLKGNKEYSATVVLGTTTDTLDPTGKVVEVREFDPPSEKTLENILDNFRGEIIQTPPKYSALKVNGIRSYKAARQGREVQVPPRNVSIYKLELKELMRDSFTILVECSHGTYIRSLAHDIGQALGCGAHLGRLVRTRVGDYRLEDAFSLRDFLALVESGRESA